MPLGSVLDRIAPPPQYLSLPSLGVDISDTSLKYVQFRPSQAPGQKMNLTAWGEVDIPHGVVNRGQVLAPEKLVEVLKVCKEKTGATYVRISLPEERAYLFETEVKRSTPMKELQNVLEFRLEENVPIPAREAIFGYEMLPHSGGDRMAKVVVAAYARETILHYYDACRAAGLHPISFEVEAAAMARAVLPEPPAGAHMLIDFGKTRTGVGIVYEGVLMYTSTIDFGGNQLSEVMRKELGMLSEDELTKIKNSQGLIRGVTDSKVYDSLISTISVIKDEVATRIAYWNSADQAPERRLQSIILCGGSSNLRGMPEYLSEVLNVTTRRADVWQNAFSVNAFVPPISLRHSYGYATAIGLALGRGI